MNIATNTYKKFIHAWWLLKITYGLVFIVAGVDKFFNLITQWDNYVNPLIAAFFPISIVHTVFVAALIEITLGLMILTRWTRAGAYALAAWLGIIIVNLLLFGIYFDIAVRDAVIAIGAIALAWLTDVKEEIFFNNY